MDAVGIERRLRIATRFLVLVGARAKPERRVVNPLWRIEPASDEGERIARARHQRSANVVGALDQAIFMADAGTSKMGQNGRHHMTFGSRDVGHRVSRPFWLTSLWHGCAGSYPVEWQTDVLSYCCASGVWSCRPDGP